MLLVDSWPIDLLVHGELSAENDITDFPTEDGSSFSDHQINRPIQFSAEGIISDTPIGEIEQHESRRIDEVTVAVFGSDQVPLPSSEGYELLMGIRNDKRFVTVEVPFPARGKQYAMRVFQRMGIENLSIPIARETAGGLHFSVTFKQLDVAKNLRTTVLAATPAGGKGGKGGKVPIAVYGRHILADDSVIWRFSILGPGGLLLQTSLPGVDTHPWAEVALEKGEGNGTGHFYTDLLGAVDPHPNTRFFYTGESGRGFPYDATNGRELVGRELAYFLADMRRDKRAVVTSQFSKRAEPAHQTAGITPGPAGTDLDVGGIYAGTLPPGYVPGHYLRPPRG